MPTPFRLWKGKFLSRILILFQLKEITWRFQSCWKTRIPSSDIFIFYINVNKYHHSFFEGTSTEIYGYNKDYPGPVIKATRGKRINERILYGAYDGKRYGNYHGPSFPYEWRPVSDTVLVYSGETLMFTARFLHLDRVVYHCHILEHDHLGIMGIFQVQWYFFNCIPPAHMKIYLQQNKTEDNMIRIQTIKNGSLNLIIECRTSVSWFLQSLGKL